MAKKIIMTPEDIRRTLARIAHEIIEQNKTVEHLILVGIHTRGVPLARRLAGFIEDFEGLKIPVGALDPSPYRDDLPSSNHREMPIRANYIGKNVPSSRREGIEVRLVETDGIDEVAITSVANHHPKDELKKVGYLKRSYHGSGK